MVPASNFAGTSSTNWCLSDVTLVKEVLVNDGVFIDQNWPRVEAVHRDGICLPQTFLMAFNMKGVEGKLDRREGQKHNLKSFGHSIPHQAGKSARMMYVLSIVIASKYLAIYL